MDASFTFSQIPLRLSDLQACRTDTCSFAYDAILQSMAMCTGITSSECARLDEKSAVELGRASGSMMTPLNGSTCPFSKGIESWSTGPFLVAVARTAPVPALVW